MGVDNICVCCLYLCHISIKFKKLIKNEILPIALAVRSIPVLITFPVVYFSILYLASYEIINNCTRVLSNSFANRTYHMCWQLGNWLRIGRGSLYQSTPLLSPKDTSRPAWNEAYKIPLIIPVPHCPSLSNNRVVILLNISSSPRLLHIPAFVVLFIDSSWRERKNTLVIYLMTFSYSRPFPAWAFRLRQFVFIRAEKASLVGLQFTA